MTQNDKKTKRKLEISERTGLDGSSYFAARALPLGLTAYGDTRELALARLKLMFSVWADAHFKQLIEVDTNDTEE